MARKEYSDIAVETTLVGNLAIGGLSLTLSSAAGYPAGTYQFVVKVDDELILCDTRSGTTVTINSAGRGFSGTTAIAHSNGAVVSHPWESHSATDMQRHIYDAAHDDHTQYQKESEKNQNNGYAGLDGSGVVPAARIDATIARDAEVTSAITTHSGAADPHGDRAYTDTHAVDTTNVHGIVDFALIWQAGDLKVSARTSPATGWLACDGAAVSRATYSALFSAISTSFGVGDGSTTFNVPDYRGRALVGAGSGPSLTARTLGAKGGEETHVIDVTELPSHSHSINHDHASATTSTDGAHTHGTNVVHQTPANNGGLGLDPPGTARATDSSGSHSHTLDLPAFTGTSGTAGSGTAANVMQPFTVGNVFIKT